MAYIDREEAIKHIETHIPYRCADDFVEGHEGDLRFTIYDLQFTKYWR